MTHATIAAQVSALTVSQVAQPADDPMSAFATEQAQLAAAATPQRTTAPGSSCPTAAADRRGDDAVRRPARRRPAVLVFYRGAWCPFCNIALRTYQQALLPELDRRRVALVAISPQAPDGVADMQEKHDLISPSCPTPGSLCAQRRHRHRALEGGPRSPAAARAGPTVVNADGTTALPLPTVAIVAPDHSVRWLDVHVD